MSWQQWQPPAQPAMPAMMNAAMPMGIQYTTEQWQQMQQQNWQQWAQWQQQYQQWHQQYGAEYQKLTAMAGGVVNPMANVMNTTAPPPLPCEAKPPPPPDEPLQHFVQMQNLAANVAQSIVKSTPTMNVQGYNTIPVSKVAASATGANVWKSNNAQIQQGQNVPKQDLNNTTTFSNNNSTTNNNKRPSNTPIDSFGDMKKHKVEWNTQGQDEDLSDPEKKFMRQFAEWEAQFNKWKDQNQDHPDKAQYREYEKKWEAWRNQLLDRREMMRKKRLGLIPASVNINTSLEMKITTKSSSKPVPLMGLDMKDFPGSSQLNPFAPTSTDTTSSLNPMNSSSLANLFNTTSNDGIPGLDLVDAPSQPEIDPPNKDESSRAVADNNKSDGLKGPDLNLEALSKNINSILGDQKLLSMLSLVAQKTNIAQKDDTPPQTLELPPSLQSNTLAQRPPPCIVEKTPKWEAPVNNISGSSPWGDQDIQGNDQGNWSGSLNNTSGNPTWNQDLKGGYSQERQQQQNSQSMGREYNSGRALTPRSNGRSPSVSAGGGNGQNFKDSDMRPQAGNYQNENFNLGNQNVNISKGQPPPNYRNNNYSTGSSEFTPRDQPSTSTFNDDFDRNEPIFGMNNRDRNSFDTFSERKADNWHQNQNLNEPINIAPAPPTITDFDEMLHIDKVINYNHKSKKQQDVVDVKVISPRLFDYRHKLVTRIPLPERPKWLSDSFYNIPEFEPPISRPNPQFSRYSQEQRYDYHHAGPTYNRYDDFGTFSRRPPASMPYDNSDKNAHMPNKRDFVRPDEEKRRIDYGTYERRPISGKWPADGRDARNTDKGRDYEARRNRNSRDREPGRKTSPVANSASGMGNSYLFGGNGAVKQELGGSGPAPGHCVSKTCIDDLLCLPGRAKRPPRIVIILRGPPGSGKTFLAKQIKDKESESDASAPRILSLDDYFMVEQEKEVIEDGKTVKVKDMVYEYEECMEAAYRQSLLKAFKKTITDGYFSFIIVDNVNDKVKYFDEMWSFAKQNGFQVYICQLELDVQICTKRNTHGRSEVEIKHIVAGWEELPTHYGVLDATNLIQAGSIPEVEMEEINSPNDDFGDDDDDEEQACNSSKWDNFECSIDNLAKLDGINKPLRSAGTMEDYLQLEEWTVDTSRDRKPGQKRVRWADLEERKEQDKMRAIGFVVGQTDWGRMMDPTQGGSALTQTKYIERVGIRKVNTN